MSSVRHLNNSKENQKSIFGIYFCSRCQNVMTPYKAQGPNLEFRCQSCGLQEIDFNTRYGENCLLYSKELQVGSKKYTPDLATILDPTMPSVEAECPECGYDRAIYSLTPDEGETKIIVKMICASRTGTTAKCGHIWELDECDELQQTRVITQQMRQQFNE